MKRVISVLMATCLLFLPLSFENSTGEFAESGAFRNMAASYDAACLLFEEQSYQAAIELFTELGSYRDSIKYRIYAEGMLTLADGALDDAEINFDLLAQYDFLDSKAVLTYIHALRAEMAGDTAKALELYRGIDALDSLLRALELEKAQAKEAPLATVAPGNVAARSAADALAAAAVSTATAPPVPQQATEIPSPQIISEAFDNAAKVENYARAAAIDMGDADAYKGMYKGNEGMNGVLAFRGGNMRQNAAFGVISPGAAGLEAVWVADAGVNAAGRATWNAQPLIVQWHKQIREMMPLNGDKKNKSALSEVIFPASDGSIYFFDLDDGLPTRDALRMRTEQVAPMLASAAVHPAGLPILFVGTGDPYSATLEPDAGMAVHNLLTQREMGLVRGDRREALSLDTTFVTSALVDTATDTMITVGGNGLLYTMALNAATDSARQEIAIAPKVQFYASGVAGMDMSVQSSLAVYGGTAYFASRGGILQAVDLNTLTPGWAVNVGGETRAAIALDADGAGGVSLYTATIADETGKSVIRRINAVTGEVIWGVGVSGSVKASPVIGQNGIGDLVIFAAGDGSTLYALEKSTGTIAWQCALSGNDVASPLAVYDEQGGAYILQGDAKGMRLLEAGSGAELDALEVEGTPMGSPAAFGNMLVFATDAGKLYGVTIN